MHRASDPMLVDMFDSLYRELAAALEHRHRCGEPMEAEPDGEVTIARLTVAIEGVEEALARLIAPDVRH
jgi:hypothetical protein